MMLEIICPGQFKEVMPHLRRPSGKSVVVWGFPGGSEGKASACNAGDLGLIPGSGRSPGYKFGLGSGYGMITALAIIFYIVGKIMKKR